MERGIVLGASVVLVGIAVGAIIASDGTLAPVLAPAVSGILVATSEATAQRAPFKLQKA